ncbi:WxL protein peptidoglycan domain-containing protein [Paenibacillus sonchi]|uniref:WxL protein peptidoglycan domain-containing protein n=1 Tax=Paenibacillus sonchi TaxID=373687 RepID=UPI001E4328B4|nr:DUF916 domain-containing protein [Paenibacillus sonchi]MCE3203476.1 DUF916 domain-containing protein [Paenibacillus sonchi]
MEIRKVGALLFMLCMSCFGLAGIASADSSFTISPIKAVEEGRGYYKDTVQPGQVREYTFYLRNLKNETLPLTVYPADARPAQNGGRSFGEKEQPQTLVGSWLSPQKVQNVTLAPKEERQFSFRVKVPKSLTPGQYVGVVAAEERIPASPAKSLSQQASVAIDVVNRAGVQIVLEYKPKQSKHTMSIDAFRHDYIPAGNSRLTIDLSNSGTILEKPKGKIIVRDSKNQVMYQSDYAADSIYAGTTANMVYVVNDKLLLPDTYSVYYEATFSGKTINRTFNFTVTRENLQQSKQALIDSGKIEVKQTFEDWLWQHSWIIILVFFLFILILILAVWLALVLSKRKKKEEQSQDDSTNPIPVEQSGAGSS